MRQTTRHLWVLCGGVAALVVGLTAHFPAPALGERFANGAETRLGITLDATRSSFSLTRGIALTGVTAVLSSRDLLLSAKVESLRAAHALTLRGPRRITAIRLVRPELTVVVGAPNDGSRETLDPSSTIAGPAGEDGSPADADETDSTGTQLGDLAIDLERATVEMRAPGADTYPLRATGLDISLPNVGHDRSASSLIHGLAGVGTLDAEELWIGPVLVLDASSRLTLSGGHFLLSDLTFACEGRTFLLPEVDIDFTSDPFSFGTRSNILERVQPDPDEPAEWVPIASLTELDGLCGG